MKNFSALNTKIQAMHSKLARDKDFLNLVKKDNLRDVIAYIKDNLYIGSYFDGYENIYEVSKLTSTYKKDQIKKLGNYLDGAYRKFYLYTLSQFEINDIKRTLRVLQRNDDTDRSYLSISISGKSYRVKQEDDIPDLVSTLADTKYYKILKPYEDKLSDVILFYMEMNLDRIYYTELIEAAKDFNKKDYQAVEYILGSKIDTLNLRWIYRGIKYYDLMPEELINFCIFGSYKFNYDKLLKLCYSKNIEEFLKQVEQTIYEFMFEGKNIDIFMDRRANRYLYYLAKEEFKKNKNDISKFLSFMLLLEYEIRDISSVMESTRFKLSPQETLNYLVRKIEEVL